MKWKTFFQVVLLIIIAAAVFYTVYPKYRFGRIEPTYRTNNISGEIEFWLKNRWINTGKKSLVPAE